MRNLYKLLFLSFFLLVDVMLCQGKKKVACIGDSVTKGYNIASGKSYPEQLQRLLGHAYQVENFGRNGATLLEQGHNPYLTSQQLLDALAFNPDIVVIALGLNDTDPRNWPNYQSYFQRDYNKLIGLFKNQNPEIEVFVCQMSPIFSGHPRFLSGTREWYSKIQSEIQEVAAFGGFKLVDLHQPLARRIDLFDDFLHPNERGAEIIAKTVFNNLKAIKQPLSVHHNFTSHMVLQRDQKNRIMGKADAEQLVTVELNGVRSSTTADDTGNWWVDLEALPAGGPCRITIHTRSDSIVLDDVLFGDVFLASGQSNMAFPLRLAKGAEALVRKSAKYERIRFFKNNVLKETANEEWDRSILNSINELQYFSGKWERITPANSGGFSAIAYSFAVELYDQLDVPIGIVELAVGGSPTESWISRKSLEQDPLLASYIHSWRTSDFIQDFCKDRAKVNLRLEQSKNQRHPYQPAYNFEAGYDKWKDTSLKGILWYQGESNAHNIELHEHLFRTLVNSWRQSYQSFAQQRARLPFYTVQLSSLSRPSWPMFRDSQRKLSNELSDVFMAVSSDLGDSLDVHPKDKLPIGRRLANLVLKHEFERVNNADSPQPVKSFFLGENLLGITFRNVKQFKAEGSNQIIGFQSKDHHGNYKDLKVVELKGDTVILAIPKNISAIFYGYAPFSRANLVNEDSVPVSTFSLTI